jgi:hypothetical protein
VNGTLLAADQTNGAAPRGPLQEANMRKTVLSGVAALGLMAIGLSLTGPASGRMTPPDVQGPGTEVQAHRHIVANAGYAGKESQLMADAEGSGADVQANRPWSLRKAKSAA